MLSASATRASTLPSHVSLVARGSARPLACASRPPYTPPPPHHPPHPHPQGIENIPNEPCIFICNHQSFVDPTLITFPLKGILFQCLFKSSLIYAPGVGSTLLLCGHIAVDRANTKGTGGTSTKGALAQADAALANGTNVVFFVEGTRKIDTAAGPLGEFKPGAFWAAQKAQVPMVPMTISGARRLFPPGLLLLFGDVTITVHPPIPPPARGADAASSKANVEETMSRAKRVIASALRDYDCVESGNKAGHGAENEKDKERLIVSKSLPPSPARQVVGGGGGTCNTDAIMGMGDADAPMPMPIKKVSHKD